MRFSITINLEILPVAIHRFPPAHYPHPVGGSNFLSHFKLTGFIIQLLKPATTGERIFPRNNQQTGALFFYKIVKTTAKSLPGCFRKLSTSFFHKVCILKSLFLPS